MQEDWDTLIWYVMYPNADPCQKKEALKAMACRSRSEELAWAAAVRERLRIQVPLGLLPEWKPSV